jgi:hypothetical protein
MVMAMAMMSIVTVIPVPAPEFFCLSRRNVAVSPTFLFSVTPARWLLVGATEAVRISIMVAVTIPVPLTPVIAALAVAVTVVVMVTVFGPARRARHSGAKQYYESDPD